MFFVNNSSKEYDIVLCIECHLMSLFDPFFGIEKKKRRSLSNSCLVLSHEIGNAMNLTSIHEIILQ